MLSRPLYEKKLPAAQTTVPPARTRRDAPSPRLAGRVLMLCALGLLAVFGLVAASMGGTSVPEVAKTLQPAPEPVALEPVKVAAAPSAPVILKDTTRMHPAKAAQPEPAPAAALPRLDEFKDEVATETDAAERMKQILQYLEKGSSEEKRGAYTALVEMDAFARAMLPGVIEKAPETVLVWLASAAAQLQAQQSDKPLIARVLKNPGQVSPQVVLAIGKLGTPETRTFCLEAMKQERYPALRACAWEAFVYSARENDLPMLFKTLELGDANQQRWAGQALGRLGGNLSLLQEIIRQMDQAMARQDHAQRQAFVYAATQLPASEVQPLLSSLLNDRNADTRAAAAAALARDAQTASQALALLASEQNPTVLKAILASLQANPQEMATPRLLDLMDARDPQVCIQAQKALIAAYGYDSGYQSGLWRAWLKAGAAEGDPNRAKLFANAQKKLKQQQTFNTMLAQSSY